VTDTYITIAELKGALSITSTDTTEDLALTSVLTSAAGAVTAYCDRYFGQVGTIGTPVARIYPTDGSHALIDDLVSFTEVELDGSGDGDSYTTIGTAAVVPMPLNAATQDPARPYTSIKAKSYTSFPEGSYVRLTGVWGWPAVPSAIKDATLLQAVRLYSSKNVPLGIVGGMDVSPMRLGTGLHPDARQLCEPYVRSNI
jgi:hypothetical protein